ncbi:MAG: cytidylate kinase-like family protein [Eubacteriales bacterium]|nr:cytidylate kinase-like family protein [Eubacteriales bacterium]
MSKYIVTISRQYGSGGKTIAGMFAEKQGIPCYGRDIIRRASDESGISEALFAQADEKLVNGTLFGISKKIYRGELLPPSSSEFTSPQNLFNYQAKIIRDLADQPGSSVFIGRCADFVLADRPETVSVFIHAPKDYCLEQARLRNPMSGVDLEKFVAKTDKFRGDFYRYYTGREWNDARNFDLCLDSSKLGFEGCVSAIEAYLKVRFGE